MPLASTAERIVLAKRVGCKLHRHENAPQVGMAVESDAEHVENFALHPIRAGPQRHGRRQRGVGIVDSDLDDDQLGGVEVAQDVVNLEPRVRSG